MRLPQTPSASVGQLPSPRGYQPSALDAIVTAHAQANDPRGQLRAACGTGKTLVGLHAALRLCPDGLVVVACPSLALIAQTLSTWALTGITDVLAVCSDDTVSDAIVHTTDLSCPVTLTPAEITRWLRTTRSDRMRLIAVTHVSADRLGVGLADAHTAADLLIVDEAHRTAGRSAKRAALLHHNQGLPARSRLYMTATPRILKASGRPRPPTTEADNDILSMDDPSTFGPVWFDYPFSQAIEDGWLDDFQVVVIGVRSREALEVLRGVDARETTGVGQAPLRTAVVQTALIRAATEFGLRRILSFTNRIADSREFARTLPGTLSSMPEEGRPKGTLTVGHVDGGQSVAQRMVHLHRLAEPPEDGWTVISNPGCLSEGIDVPAVDAVVFTRPKKSTEDILQAVGRALRRNPAGSGIATVLIPVLLPDDPAHLPDHDEEWAIVWQVLNALRAHDASLAAQLDTCRVDLAATGAAQLPARVILRLPDDYTADALLRHITVRVLQRTAPGWLVSLAAARTFRAREGHLRVPRYHQEGDIGLGSWIHNCRTSYHSSRLAADQVTALEELGIAWTGHEENWQRHLTAAQTFRAREGHLQVPRQHREGDVNLGVWIHNCRRGYHAETLTPDRIKALRALDMLWTVQQRR